MSNKLDREGIRNGVNPKSSMGRVQEENCGNSLMCIVGKNNVKLAYGQDVKAHVLPRLVMTGVRVLSFTSPLKAFPSDGSSTCHVPHSQI